MSENIVALSDYLNQQKSVYAAFLDIAKTKTDVIVKGKVQELEKITGVEETLVINMGKLEKEIEKCIENIKSELNISEENVNVSEIIKKTSGDLKQKLITQKEEILTILKELEHANMLNSNLINNSLEYIDFSINLYSNSKTPPSSGYGQSGSIQVNSAKSFFDKKS